MNQMSMVLAVPMSVNPDGLQVRVAGTEERPLFCLADVCAVLDLSSPHKVAERMDDDERVRNLIPTPGGPQEMWFVTEPGLFKVVLRSDKPNAKEFTRWVCHEVLPCIRRHGCYPAPAPGHAQAPAQGRPVTVGDLRDIVRDELAQLIATPAPLVQRPDGYVVIADFVRNAWPGATPRIVGRVVRRADQVHQRLYGRPCPKEGERENAPLVAEYGCMQAVIEAMNAEWRREYETEPDLFPGHADA